MLTYLQMQAATCLVILLNRSVPVFLFFLSFPFFVLSQSTGTVQLPAGITISKSNADALNSAATNMAASNLDSALLLANRAKEISRQLDYMKGEAGALAVLTLIYQNKGSYPQAITSGLEALKRYEQLNDKAAQGATLLALALVYKDMSGNERTSEYNGVATTYSRKALGLYKTIADTAGIINSLSLVGTLFRDKAIQTKKKSFYDTAFFNFSKAIGLLSISTKGSQYTSKLYNNISQVYIEQKKDYPTALRYLFKAVDINRRNNNSISLSFNYGNIAQTYVEMHKLDSALLYSRKMLNAGIISKRPSRIINGLLQMYRLYEASGHSDSALHYYIAATHLNDSVNSLAVTRQVDELKTKYETEKKEAEIRLLNTENQIKNTRIVWLVTGLAIFGLLAIGLIALYRRVQKQRVLLAAQATRLEVMMKELHHRVKNNLQIVSSLLNMQTYKLHDEESINALKASGERVQAMSLIHQRLYKKDELTSVNLKEYITDLAESLMQSYGYNHNNFELQIQVQQELMDVDTALPIGLIVNELITNALKYAYTRVQHPVLQVSLMGQGSSICLQVKDNGVDFSEAKWQQNKGSFGKQLITSLCRQLRARQTIDTSTGTNFIITIPLKAA